MAAVLLKSRAHAVLSRTFIDGGSMERCGGSALSRCLAAALQQVPR